MAVPKPIPPIMTLCVSLDRQGHSAQLFLICESNITGEYFIVTAGHVDSCTDIAVALKRSRIYLIPPCGSLRDATAIVHWSGEEIIIRLLLPLIFPGLNSTPKVR